MSFVVRPAEHGDLPAIYEMARSTGGGFTNLPPDRDALEARLSGAVACFRRDDDVLGDDFFLFVLEDLARGEVRGTCQLHSRVGSSWPFYSYRIDHFATYSKEIGKTIAAEILTLSTDLSGSSEVGGLYLHPGERATGAGALLARSRYLFMKMHRQRFAPRTIAELRGVQDEGGGSPFWDALAGRFFDMGFQEADAFNAIHGNQFIADLMPKHPIYTALLPPTARAVIGQPHQSGRAARHMLEKEGFASGSYVDIFDGGPAMTVVTDDIATIRAAREARMDPIGQARAPAQASIVAHGRLSRFRASWGEVAVTADGVMLDPAAAEALHALAGESVTYIRR